MRRRSLRLRLLALSALAVVAALAIAGAALVAIFERHLERRIGQELDIFLTQLAAQVMFADGHVRLAKPLAEPRFAKPYSGLYWQVRDEANGDVIRSRSLWDRQLALPADKPPIGKLDIHDVSGPGGKMLRVHERRLIYRPDGEDHTLYLAVAIERADIDRLEADFAGDVAVFLVILALLLIAAGWLQLTYGLAPLKAVTRRIGDIREGRAARLGEDVPEEIAPLVAQTNALLAERERAIERARARAGDLAHGFKTPLTALTSDVARLRAMGVDDVADDIAATTAHMRRHIERELTRTRVMARRQGETTDIAEAVRALARTLSRTDKGERLRFEIDCPDGLVIAMARDDFNEVVGNLMENAARHGVARVKVAARRLTGGVEIAVEDDGEGIAQGAREALMKRGASLDETGAGTGLGLAIVGDVLATYDSEVTLESSPLGGLKAGFRILE